MRLSNCNVSLNVRKQPVTEKNRAKTVPRKNTLPCGPWPGTLNSSEKTKVKGRPAESNCDTHSEDGV